MRRYLPDFIVLVDDGHGPDDLLHLVVEIKGYRREDAKEKELTMDSYSVPGVNHLGAYGRWAFAEFTEVYQIEADFEARVESQFDELIAAAANGSLAPRQSIVTGRQTTFRSILATVICWRSATPFGRNRLEPGSSFSFVRH